VIETVRSAYPESSAILIWATNMSTKAEVRQGTPALMVLETLNAMGPSTLWHRAPHRATSDDLLSTNHGKLVPVLFKFFDRLLAKVSALPGVQASGLVTALPTNGETWKDPIYLEGDGRRRSERHLVNNSYSSPGYFRAMSIAIHQGRASFRG
jgi:hypothetical protein